MAHKRKYAVIVHFRVYRDLTICCWSLNIEGSSFLFSHPTPSEAAKPPKPIPFRGFSSKLILWLSSFFQNRPRGSRGPRRGARGGPGGQGGQGGQGK